MALRRKCNGAKHGTEALATSFGGWVGERSLRAEGVPEGMLDCSEVIMLTLVTIKYVKNILAEKPRFPG